MSREKNRIVGIVLAIVMMASILPVHAFGLAFNSDNLSADDMSIEDVSLHEDITDEKSAEGASAEEIAELASSSLVIGEETILSVTASGECEDGLRWNIVGGKLSITGVGAMGAYSISSPAPWFAHKDAVTSIEVCDGVVSIGDYAFYGFEKATEIKIADSVNRIEAWAFHECNSIEEISLPFIGKSRTSVNNSAVCESVFGYIFGFSSEEVEGTTLQYSIYCYIPETIRRVEITSARTLSQHAFRNCSSLTEIRISNTVSEIGLAAFAGCTSLERLTLPFVGKSRTGRTFSSSGVISAEGHFGYIFERSSSGTAVWQRTNNTMYNEPVGHSIPSSLKYVTITDAQQVGDYAFDNCTDLRRITFHGKEAPSFGLGCFGRISVAIYYPSYWDTSTLGNYDGDVSWVPYDAQKLISWVSISPIENQAWTGRDICPRITVKDGARTLAKGADYAVEYFDNRNPGVAKAVVTGQGNYAGSVTVQFNIIKKPSLYALLINGARGQKVGCDNDAALMYQLLCDNELSEYVVQKSNIYCRNYGATGVEKDTVTQWISDAFSNAKEDDLLVFFYTGHSDEDGISLSFYDANTHSYIYYTWDLLTDALCKTASKHIVIIQNSCYSGGLISHIRENLSPSEQNRLSVITSSSESESSWNKEFKGCSGILYYSRFTYYLGRGIGFVDDVLYSDTEGPDGKITLRELYEYVSEYVEADKDNKTYPMAVQLYPSPDSTDDARLSMVLFEYHTKRASLINQINAAAKATKEEVTNVVSTLKETITNKLVDVISSSLETQNNISQLESTYCESNHVTVSAPVSSIASIPASGIEVVGAGLSGRENDTLLLSVSNTDDAPEYDTSNYVNPSFFDMRMTSSNRTVSTDLKELDIPATITLPVPESMDMSKLYVLHFRDDGSADEIKPTINSETRSAKFVITGFSTFAFAESVNEESMPITVFLDANEGSVATLRIPVYTGGTYESIPTPFRDGYNFEGWFTEKDGGAKVDNTTVVTIGNDHTLYAHWSRLALRLAYESLDYGDNGLAITSVLANDTSNNVSGQIIAAVYNDVGKMLNCIVIPNVSVDVGKDSKNNINFDSLVLQSGDDITVKLFLLDDSLCPLTNAAVRTYTYQS